VVPGAVTGAGASGNGAPPVVADPGAAPDEPLLRIDRAGPGGGVPSDNAFGVALVSLWQRVIEAGGPVGFAPPVVRPEVAGRAAGLVDEVRTGRVIAVAANRSHRLIGAALLRPGRGSAAHTGHLELILVDPAHVRSGIGGQLLTELLRLASDRGLQAVDLDAADGAGLDAFFSRFGFEQWGRRPGWVRSGPDDVHDEIVWGATL
jgi:GNAT superfamily N-acetyltransferase